MSATPSRADGASDLTARFTHALDSEPPFETPFGEAVASAVRAGRRRRARSIAGRGLAIAACGLVIGASVLAVRPDGSLSPATDPGLFGAASDPAASPVPTPTLCVSAPEEAVARAVAARDQAQAAAEVAAQAGAPDAGDLAARADALAEAAEKAESAAEQAGSAALGTSTSECPESDDSPVPVTDISAADLEPLAKAIAAVRGGDVTIVVRGSEVGTPTVTAQVSGPDGAYDITVQVTGTAFAPDLVTRGCTSSDRDDKPCNVELALPDRAAVSVAFSDGSGRANLRYGEPAGVGRTVSVWVDNYTEQADGTKAVGPTWKAAGVTPSHIHAAIADSGLAP